MKYKIIYEQVAITDISNLIKYISLDLLAESAARSLLDILISGINSLEYLPNRNPTVSEPPYNLLQIKKMIIDNYIVFYKVNDRLKEVHILRVLNMRQHWQDYL